MSRSVQTPSKAFAFPNEWQPVRLGSIGKTYGGLTGKSGEDFNTGSASYVTFMQVMGNSRLREPAKGTVNINPGERQNHVQKDDLLFNGSSETPEEVALAAAVDFHPDSDTFLNSFCFGFRLLPDAPADSLFLAYLFRSSVGRNLVSSLAQGATRYNISKTQLLNQAIHLPPKAEQIAIREKLTDAEELINSLERLISKKRAIKQGIMQELLTGRTRLPGFQESWVQTKIGKLASVFGGGTPSTKTPSYWNGDIPWFTPGEISKNGSGLIKSSERSITSEGLQRSGAKLLPANSILVTSRASLGHCAVAEVPVATNQGFTSLVPKDSRSSWFLYYWMQHNRHELQSRAAGSTFLEISSSKVESIPITIPSIREQEAVAGVLRDADNEIDALDRRLESTRSIKQGMMQELLTGRTRLVSEGVR
ncbi:restriction endonuclease subunit S [Corynebacterium sanguinis]|uniref:Restriction endonuclease subunit S n=1 Tax=Corynebacterium sanguinis TaxID=2594913 RepID=A0A838X6A4_9CORY|nr:restriction endonuclease subunit S [Corynebacterium sanguinis]MBA4506337.1 restriction endonuclease subunit S [Corynebacterium sanguinis]